MKFSIVIPQLFYDLIARILPGFFFLTLVLLSLPELTRYLYPHVIISGDNFVASLGRVVGYAAICYFLGQLFFAFTWGSKRKAIRKRYEEEIGSKSINEKYQRIRLVHPPSGFRIVKLRAEARMFEATRTAMVAIIILTIVYLCILLILAISESYSINKVTWLRSLIGLLIAMVSLYGFYKREEKAWENYYGNINIIYKILHDYVDPVKPFPDNT
jgi:hypothetical protein